MAVPVIRWIGVSTHSRLKAAGPLIWRARNGRDSFNTQPPEGGWAARDAKAAKEFEVSTHSRLKAAGKAIYRNCRK